MVTTATEVRSGPHDGHLRLGDRVIVVDAPSWCRRHLAGRSGRVVRFFPFTYSDVWVRFDQPLDPWCGRMDPLEEFPFSRDQLVSV